MIEFIKSIFTKESKYNAGIYIQNKLEGKALVEYAGDTLEITFSDEHKDKNLLIKLKGIKDLKLVDNELSFISDNKKYKIKDSSCAEDLYKKINPLIFNSYIFKGDGVKYFLYNSEIKIFEEVKGLVNIRIYFEDFYYMRIENETEIIHFEEINTKIQYYIDEQNLSFVWSTFSDGKFYTFSIKFPDSLMFLEFRSKFIESMFRSNNSEGDYEYFSKIGDINVENISSKTENEELTNLDEYSDVDDNEVKIDTKNLSKESYNKHLVVGNNQCFVTRGNSLGVFDLTSGDLKFRAHIKNVINNPEKIITHNGDRNLLVLNTEEKTNLDLIDLEKGEVIEKWKMDENINDYFNSIKYENESTLVGLSDKSLFRIDPRVKNKIVSKKNYKTKPGFLCGNADMTGNLAIASKKGDLRLYDKLDKRAKTLLPGFGDKVYGIDTNKDGSLILCTCKNYILVYQVNSNYSINCKNSIPRRLQLKPQHLSLITDEVNFTIAKFDQNDSLIITSTGPFVIKWKVSDVSQGIIYNYSIKRFNDKIMDEDFVMNGNDVIITLKNDVRKMNENELKRPKF